jgi:hypothetical protein
VKDDGERSGIPEEVVAQTITEFFCEELPLSQDDVLHYGCLCELFEIHSKTDLVRYFKSEAAK